MKHTLFGFTAALLTITAFALILTIVSTAKAVIPSYTVDTTADDVNLAACSPSTPNDCSLRGAISTAAAGATINFDASVFASAQTIQLNGTELAIGKNLTITGTGANLLTINGNAASRVFEITGAFTVTIEKLTITNGKLPATGSISATRQGGGIYNSGILTLNNVIVSNNSAPGGGGGGIYSFGTGGITLNLNNSTVTNNNAASGAGIRTASNTNISNSIISNNFPTPSTSGGGGIFFIGNGGVLTITNSAISGNSAINAGGGISASLLDDTRYTLFIKNSTVSGNTVTGNRGGGIFISGSNNTGLSQYLIQNSTVSGNTASGVGGGIDSELVDGDIINSTITNNTSNETASNGGGGIFDPNPLATDKINLLNTIIAGNFNPIAPDIRGSGYVSYGNNLIGSNQGGATYISNGSGDQIGTSANPINALLEPLGNYGGATIGASGEVIQTHALLSNSLAVNAGNDCVKTSTCMTLNPSANLTTDQRGANRIGAVDIGAFEYNTTDFTAALPDGKTGQAYSQTIVPNTTLNGTTYNYCYIGTLPPGLSAGIPQCPSSITELQEIKNTRNNAANNKYDAEIVAAPTAALVISGTPTMGGTFNFSLLASDGSGNFGTTKYSINIIAGPTAASATIGGRAMTSGGRGIANVRITLTDATGAVRIATTSAFGYYRFTDVAAGATYIVSASGKRFTFAQQSQVLNVVEDTDDVNFISDSTN